MVLAAVVVAVAVVIVLVGAQSGGGAGLDSGDGGRGGVTVTGAPSADGPSDASVPGGGSPSPSGSSSPSASSSSGQVVVHVLGAVQRAGLVTLGAGSRVSDALRRAGGATTDADLARLNLARALMDGERLYVPRVGEVDIPEALGPAAGSAPGSGGSGGAAGGAGGAAGPGAADTVVDLNTADQAALETLPGIGPSLAARILAWRDEHGRFTAVEDLLDVSGIGAGRFADLRDRVRV